MDFWGRILWKFLNACSHSRMQCQVLASCAGYVMEIVGSSSCLSEPEDTWTADPKHPLGIYQRKTDAM